MRTLTADMHRYSPKDISEYARLVRNIPTGPAHSDLLRDDPEAWNLAFLSFDFDRRLEHPDPHFTVNVSRSVKTVLLTGEPDLAEEFPVECKVRHLLRLPAAQFVHEVLAHPVLTKLPLYRAYGPAWVKTIRERSFLCQTPASHVPDDNLTDLSAAEALLGRFIKR